MKQRIISILCVLAMLLSVLPAAALASEIPELSGACGEAITWELDPAEGLLTIDGDGPMPDYSYSTGAPWYAYRSRIFHVVLTGTVDAIGAYAFRECSALVSVDASACTISAIGAGAFEGCALLETVSFTPGETLLVGDDAFADCAALKSLKLDAAAGEIGRNAFYGCFALEEIALPKKMTALADGTFMGCSNLKELFLPETLESIGRRCFVDCTGLTELSFPASLTTIERDAFERCLPLTLRFAGSVPAFAPAADSTASFPAETLLQVPFQGEGWEWPICKGYHVQWIFPTLDDVFSDVDSDSWYTSSVQHVYYTGRMNGVGEKRFAPANPMTRAELVTVLYRMAGSPTVDVENPFEDVPEASFYYDAVRWAQANKVVTGTSATSFKPMDRVNREQIATILYRYAATLELDLSQRDPLTGFTDAETVSNFAKDPMSWCVAIGLINGKPGGLLDPAGTASRAEVAKILTGFETHLATLEILARDDWMEDFQEPEPGPEIDPEDPLYLYALEVFEAVNRKRTEMGLSGLEWNDYMYLAAKTRAEELTAENGFSHTRPDGTNYATVFEEFGIETSTRNEIIARGYTSAQALVDAWASTGSSSPVISALVYSSAAVGVYQLPPAENEEVGRYYYVLLVAG